MIRAGAALQAGLIGAVRAYQLAIRPLIGGHCRFEPGCSAYAIDAIRAHGAGRGALLAGWRVMRCNPFCAGGHDPVPPSPSSRTMHATIVTE